MLLNCITKFNVSNLPSLLQAINAFDEQAYKSTSVVEADWLFHIDGLGEFLI